MWTTLLILFDFFGIAVVANPGYARLSDVQINTVALTDAPLYTAALSDAAFGSVTLSDETP